MDSNTTGALLGAAGLILLTVACGLGLVMLISLWCIFAKAGQPGWASLIPIYNTYIKLKISGKPGWWLLLFLIPIVNFVIAIMMILGLAKHFNKGGGFAVGMIFLPIIFYPILAFDRSEYNPNVD